MYLVNLRVLVFNSVKFMSALFMFWYHICGHITSDLFSDLLGSHCGSYVFIVEDPDLFLCGYVMKPKTRFLILR
jgi:hypothetical protein